MQKKISIVLILLLSFFNIQSCFAKDKKKHKHLHTVHYINKGTNNIECLAKNIYFEASGESEKGQKAVGVITINRAKEKDLKSNNVLVICNVVYAPGQFEWTPKNPTVSDKETYSKIKTIAQEIYNDYYLNDKIPEGLEVLANVKYFSKGTPKGFKTVTTIGNHKFSTPKPKKHKKRQLA